MPRKKKPTYEWVPALKLYRKRIKDADGKYFPLYGKTEEILAEKVREAEEAIKEAIFARKDPFFRDYAKQWLALNTSELSERTRKDYEYIVDLLIRMFPAAKVKEITADDIKTGMLSLKGKSASVYNKAVWLLKKIFESAVDNDIIRKSPAAKLKRGGVKAKEKQALTDEQVKVLLDAVHDTVAYPFCMVGIYAGLRREEILALKWDCIHLDSDPPYIEVRRALRWEKNQPVISDVLKSDAAARNIPIPPQLVECLRAEKEKSKSDFLIANKSGGPRSETQFKNLWSAVRCRMVGTRTYYKDKKKVVVEQRLGEKCKRHKHRYTIDFEVTPHILRHTYITNLFLSGVNLKVVQYLAGHATAEMSLDTYIHLTSNKPEQLMPEVMKAFGVKNEANQKDNSIHSYVPQGI